jgi:Peptidase propeptide and YPEB domain
VSQQGDRRAYLVVVIAAITAVGTQLRLQQSPEEITLWSGSRQTGEVQQRLGRARRTLMRTKIAKCRIVLFGSASLALLATASAIAFTGQELAKDAKVDIEQARKIALKAHPGKITDEELEREAGGSGLRYSFDIKAGKVVQEVGVDAMTGRVLENTKEGKNSD